MHRALLSAVLSLSVLLSTLVSAKDASYTFITINAPDSIDTEATGINTSGQIVGYYAADTPTPTSEPAYGFLYEDGVFTILRAPGAWNTLPRGINDGGQIVGSYTVVGDDIPEHGFLYDNGVFTALDIPGAVLTLAQGINNQGQIVGSYFDGDVSHGFLYDNGRITTIDAPGAFATHITRAHGINNRGQIVGTYIEFRAPPQNFAYQIFLYEAGVFTTIESPNEVFFLDVPGLGINNRSQIVGAYITQSPPAVREAFLYDAGVFTTLEVPTAVNSQAYAINNRGQIVGFYQENGTFRGFVATPAKK